MVMRKTLKREFSVIVERDEDGCYVARVPELRGRRTQAKSLDKLMRRIRQAVELCLDVQGDAGSVNEFIGVGLFNKILNDIEMEIDAFRQGL